MTRLPTEQLLLAASLAVEKAREHFNLDPKWHINIEVTRIDDANTSGRCMVMPDYYKAFIEVSEDVETLEEAYEVGAHEAAHVALAQWHEYADIAGINSNDSGLFPPAFRIPLEKTTVLLEKLFLAAHPYADQVASTPEVE